MTKNKTGAPFGGHLPGLDGLRVGAMTLVLLGHAVLAGLVPKGPLWRIDKAGTTVFLVLSGFLVTVLLLRERERSGRIDTGRFLARRAARLLPSYYALVAFAAVIIVIIASIGVVAGIMTFIVEQFIPVLIMVGLPIVLLLIVRVWLGRLTKRDAMIVVFTGFMTVFVVMTIVGTAFRGEGMALVWPWDVPTHPE